MIKKLLILSTLIPSLASAASVGIGGVYTCSPNGCFYGASVGETNHFDMETRDYGFRRYGFGTSFGTIGNGVGLDLSSSSGLFLVPGDGLFQVGLELGGKIVANTNGNIPSYYIWCPGFSFGPRFQVGAYNGYISIKGGTSAGNINRTDLIPSLRLYYGYSAYITSSEFSLGYEWSTFDSVTSTSCDILYKVSDIEIGIRIDNVKQEPRYSILFQSPISGSN